MSPTVASWLPTLLFVPVVGFVLYRRFKRTFGRQPLFPGRMAVRMVLLSVVGVLFLVSIPTAVGLGAAAGGAAAGVALAVVGLAYTRYEATAQGKFYTPNGWIGLAVTTLFLGRLVARMFSLYVDRAAAQVAPAAPFGGAQRSPFTLAIFFLMAAYYIVYYAGVLRKLRGPVPPATTKTTE